MQHQEMIMINKKQPINNIEEKSSQTYSTYYNIIW